MNNIQSLSKDLSKLYEEIRAGAIDLKMAGELNNTAGKILKAHQVQLAYHALRGEAPDIPFLAAPTMKTGEITHGVPIPVNEGSAGNDGPKAMTVPEFIARFKVGRTVAYAEIGSGRLQTYKVGRRRYISERAANEWQTKSESAS